MNTFKRKDMKTASFTLPNYIIGFALVFILVFALGESWGQTNTYTGANDGSWNIAGNWSLGAVPTAAHDVVISASSSNLRVDINASSVCNSLTLNQGSRRIILRLLGNRLDITTDITMTAPTGGNRFTLLNIGSGTVNCQSIISNNSGNNNRDNRIRISTGELNVSGDIAMGNNVNQNDITFTGSGTINVNGNLTTGTLVGSIGTINIGGAFTPSTYTINSSTVNYNSPSTQNIGNYTYYNLTTSGGGTKTLVNNTIATNNLTMTSGDINTGANTLTLGSAPGTVGTLTYTSGTIIGKFERWIANSSTATLDFPVGASIQKNTAQIKLNTVPTGGSLIVEYVASDPGGTGLPIVDGASTISVPFSDGYWTLTPANSLSASNFDLTLDGTGMNSYTLDANSRIITRADAGSSWLAEGTHGSAVLPLISRTGMSSLPAQVALGVGRGPTTWYSYGGGGNWNNPNTWTLDGSGALFTNPSNSVPSSIDQVVILKPSTVTMDVNNATVTSLELLGELRVEATSGHNFTVISGDGKMFMSGSAGIDNFPDGVVTQFADEVTGGTVEYNGTGLTLNNSRTFRNFILNLSNNTDALVLLNDLNINGDYTLEKGAFQVNDNSSTTVLNLNVKGAAIVEANASVSVGSGNTIGTYSIGGTLPAVGDYHNIYHQLTFESNFTNYGTVRLTNLAAPNYNTLTTTGAATVRFTGATNNTMDLFGITDFYNLVVDKGNDKTYELKIISNLVANLNLYGPNSVAHIESTPYSPANPEVRKALWIKNGTLHLTGFIHIPTLSEGRDNGGVGDFAIGQNSALWLDGENVEVYSTAEALSQVPAGASGIRGGDGSYQALTNFGDFRISNGYFGTRNSAGFIFWNANAGNIIVEGGTVNISQLRTANGGTATNSYVQSGGTVIVRGSSGQNGEVAGGYALFCMQYPDAVFSMSGGTLHIYGERGDGSIFINSKPGLYSVTGGDVIIENRTNVNAEIATTTPFWNLTLQKNGGTATEVELITNTLQGQTILNPDLILKNNFTVGSDVNFDHNGNDVMIGSDFVIQSGGGYEYDVTKESTLTLNGVDNARMALLNRTGGSADVQVFHNLIINKPHGKIITLESGKTGANLNSFQNNLFRVDGDAFKLLSGTLDQGVHSMLANCDTVVNYDVLTVFNLLGSGTDSNPNGENDQLKFATNSGTPNNIVFITADTAVIGNLKFFMQSYILTINSDLYIQYLEYSNGRLNLQDNNLKVDYWDYSKDFNGGTAGINHMIITNGKASDGGLSLYVDSNETHTFYFGVGLTGTDPSSKFTPASLTITDFADDGYVTIRPVDKKLTTTNPIGNVLSYYWKVDYNNFTTLPKVAYTFTYNDDDLDGNSEAGFVPGKVLDNTPFTRSSEVSGNFNAATNLITFNGDIGSGVAPFTLEIANYTAGDPGRFTGVVEVYYTRTLANAASSNWRTVTNWTNGANPSYSLHDSRQTPATDYPKDGDIAVVGWVPWGDPNYADGRPHGIEINQSETFAELRFSQMLDISGNPVPRDYYQNFQFRPTVCINPGGVMNGQAISGEGAFWLRSTGTQVDPDFSGIDMGEFAREDSAYMIYESTSNAFVYDNIPAEVPNLMIAGNNWGASNRDFKISTDVTVKENFELLGDVNLVLNNGAAGDILVEGDLSILELSVNNSGGNGEIAYPNDAVRTIEVLGDLQLINNQAIVNVRTPNSPVQASQLIVHGNILQNNLTGGGLILSTGTNQDYIHLDLKGSGNHSFEQVTGDPAALYTVTINKGTSKASSFSFNGNFTLTGPTSGASIPKAFLLQNGTAIINNPAINIDLTTGNDSFTIPASSGLQVTQGTVNVRGSDSGLLLDGCLTIDGGTVDMNDPGNNGNNFIEYTASGNAMIDISSGTLTVGSQIRGNLITDNGVLNYTQTGGSVVIGRRTALTANRGMLEILNMGSNFTYTGGTLTIERQNTATPTVAALRLLPTFHDVTQTIFIGNSNTPAGQTDFRINANVPLAGLTLDGGPNYPTGVIWTNPLTLTDDLTINNGATLDGNGIALTLQKDMLNNGDYTPNSNLTTFVSASSQQISGSGTTNFYDFTKDGLGVLNSTIPFTINNRLEIAAGTFDDNRHTIDLKGNAQIDGIHLSTGGGASDGLRFSGTGAQQLSRTTSGTSTLGIVTIQNANGVTILEGNGYNFNIDGALKMNGGVFNIGSSSLILGINAEITTSSSYSVTNMVKTNSSFTDNGLGKVFPAGYNSVFTFPVGEVTYTPVVMDFSGPGTSGTTNGQITVRPANEYHPTINDGNDVVPGGDVNNVLKYFWTLRASNISGFDADVKFYYDESDIKLAGGGSEADYIPARILSFNNPTYEINKFGSSLINTTTNEINFNSTFVFNGVTSNGITGDYFAGIDAAIPDNVVTYTVQGVGGEVEDPVYDKPVSGGGAPKGAIVIIPNGSTLNFTIDNVTLYKTEIQSGGELVINNSKFHRLGQLDGTGNLKIVHSIAGNPSLPAADYTTFFSCSGGGLEYAGNGSYLILGGIPDVRNLTISGSGDRNFPNNDVTICEDLTINGGISNSYSDRLILVSNDFYLNSGTFNFTTGTSSMLTINGDFTIDGGVYSAGIAGNLLVSSGVTTLNSGTFNLGGSSLNSEIRGDFNRTGGTLNAQTSNVYFNSNTTVQHIDGDLTGSNSFYNLTIDNRDGNQVFEFDDHVGVSNSLILNDGIVNTNGNTVSLGSIATVSPISGRSNSFINGKVIKTIPNVGGGFTFPIGSDNLWRPAYVLDVLTGGLDWEAQYFEGPGTDDPLVTNLTPTNPDILTMSSIEYWKISDGNIAPSGVTAIVGLSWGVESDVSTVNNEREQMEVMVWNGTTTGWDDYGGAGFSSGHSQAQGTLNSDTKISFSENILTLGSTDLSNPLPVELVSFTGKEQDSEVMLSWHTASEQNNDYFIIEHSVDGKIFTEIGDVAGAGTTTVTQYYNHLHNRPAYPHNYYRLKQVDFDGAFEYSDVILVRLKNALSNDEMDFVMYPNPSTGNEINIELSSLDYSKPLLIEVVTINGLRIISEMYNAGDFDRYLMLNMGISAKNGVYIVHISQENQHVVKKLVLK